MKKETQQLVLMLIIGILLGVVVAQLWSGRGDSNDKTPIEEVVITDEGASSTKNITAEVSKETAKEKTVPVVTGTPNALPVGSAVPANNRMGLTVVDQVAGKEVAISGFTLVSPQWFAVYDERDGAPGWILGAKRLLPGDTGGVIPLLRATEAGKRYYAVIHNDDGDLEFSKLTDPAPAIDKVIIVSFMAK